MWWMRTISVYAIRVTNGRHPCASPRSSMVTVFVSSPRYTSASTMATAGSAEAAIAGCFTDNTVHVRRIGVIAIVKTSHARPSGKILMSGRLSITHHASDPPHDDAYPRIEKDVGHDCHRRHHVRHRRRLHAVGGEQPDRRRPQHADDVFEFQRGRLFPNGVCGEPGGRRHEAACRRDQQDALQWRTRRVNFMSANRVFLSTMLWRLGGFAEKPNDDSRDAIPILRLAAKTPPSCSRQRIKPCAAIRVGQPPLGANHALT